MTDRSPSWAINAWVLRQSGLKELLGWSEGQEVPFYPTNAGSDLVPPYVIYLENITPNGVEHWRMNTDITYIMFHRSYAQLVPMRNRVIEAIKRLDKSAGELNKWLRSGEWPPGQNYANDFRFLYLQLGSAPNIQPPTQQGEAQIQMINFTACYVE